MAATEGQIRWTTEKAIKDFETPFLRPRGIATVEEMIAHYLLCHEVANEYGVSPEFLRWAGLTREQMAAQAEIIVRRRRKGAGKRALVAKLGRDGAEDYISWKAGRRIHLK